MFGASLGSDCSGLSECLPYVVAFHPQCVWGGGLLSVSVSCFLPL